ncbi:Mg2+ transporter protein, CorA family protein [Desulforamulus reducens MI-1]|uniref:Mg2+ transporter protein, CorA family protein n=1 Tax=Desulforamulus reducens (strain ATCC BAA-1160 / DSM 100696 / MI-1) TaxID=349161 RepID=A4J7W5_DESRM|nr:magnesium transporter CorA family protein [Desulforamulus reducens]ABO51168.1 Mg2+ transporter protein, CorA family protein [Desulforamulus reducens MI-1]
MLKKYISRADGTLVETENIETGSWISIVNPEEKEIAQILTLLNIEHEFIPDALDEAETPRIERKDHYIWIIIDIPVTVSKQRNALLYDTIPLTIIVTENYFVTITLRENDIIQDFIQKKVQGFYTFKKTRFVLQILYVIATYYLKYLRQINQKTNKIEEELHQSMRNEELYSLLSLSKSLVYFTTSLKANEMVMEKMLRNNYLKMYEDDKEILEDAIIENKQAIEMAHIYSNVLSGMMDAFASVISNNVNIVMKFLTSITIILAVPTMIASFFGMNVVLPLKEYPYAFTGIILFCILLSFIIGLIFTRKRYL